MELDGLPEAEAKAKAAEIRKASATVDVGSMFGGDILCKTKKHKETKRPIP